MKVRVRVQQRERPNDDTSIEKKKRQNPAEPQSTSSTIKDTTNMSTPTSPAPDQAKGATIAANTIDSSASAEMPEDDTTGNDVLPTTPHTTTVAKQDKGKQAIMPIPGSGNTAMATLPGADAKALHTTVPNAARPQRSNYAEPADWSKPTPTPTTTTSTTTTALAPAPPAPGPVIGSAVGVAAANAPSSSNQQQQQQQQQHHHPHPPPPSTAAHLPKTAPQSKGPSYYIPQSAPAAATGTVETGVASSSAASAASSIPIATSQTSTMAMPGLAPGRYVDLSGVQGQGQGVVVGPSGGLPAPATASGQRYAVNTAYGANPPAAGGMLRRQVGEAGLDGELNEAGIEKQPWWNQAWDATKEVGRKIGNGLAKLDEDFWRWQNSRS